ncbi:DUF2851 family protein [Sphingobacterium bovistauri]|uniref:DUF2851 family protein n=1 Tax=Sphingobacterium bovistauri TaxID=2781959 RepID=A0ABS7Z946_9SPHI|nr:DUF2851 family protein [Sphingobacterium bovistauri]MCA5006718.1 DUF2851 family protein [Sphingobacterium bovistauri]
MKWPEKLLHFIWRYKLINQNDLITTQGEPLRILNFGQYNMHAGADFELSKIQINNEIWVGNIELHKSSTHWKDHQHHLDPRYNSTILHVVWENFEGIKIKRSDGTEIPTLVLKNFVDESLLLKYEQLMQNEQWIACESHLPRISGITVNNWLDRLVVERLESKYEMIKKWATIVKYSWEHIQFIALGRAFGMKVNADAYESLFLYTNPNLIYKFASEPSKLEAMLFGSAGFLNTTKTDEDYWESLKKEYLYLQCLYELREMSPLEWKFLRMRPHNFPTFRLAQLCALFHKRVHWFEFIQNSTFEETILEFSNIQVSEYWSNHFHFNKLSKTHSTALTQAFIHHVILNAFVPILFAYGKYVGNEELQQKALYWLQLLPVEKNSIVNAYEARMIEASNASESQALLHLFKHYCTPKRCLDCAIGYAILKR